MIPTHVLTDLKPDESVAVLSRGGEIHIHVHTAADTPKRSGRTPPATGPRS